MKQLQDGEINMLTSVRLFVHLREYIRGLGIPGHRRHPA